MTSHLTPVPPPFVGAWQRVSLSLDGSDPHEDSDVLWIQSPTYFADIRVHRGTGDVIGCFAGQTTWSPPTLHWSRHLDLVDAGVVDEGEVTWAGGDLVETGVFPFPGTPAPVPYVERWRRLPDADPVECWTMPRGVLIHAGLHALGVVGTDHGLAACWRRLTRRGWAVVHALGDGEAWVPERPALADSPWMPVSVERAVAS